MTDEKRPTDPAAEHLTDEELERVQGGQFAPTPVQTLVKQEEPAKPDESPKS